MTNNPNTSPAPEHLTPADGGAGTGAENPAGAEHPAPDRAADGAWLRTPSGMISLAALVLSVIVPPAFFPLAGLALVLAVIALARRRPRPRSALVITIISGVLLLVVLAIGILATIAIATTQTGMPG